MLGFLAGLFRVTLGFVSACLTAGIVTVLFAVTPAELIDADAFYWQAVGGWALYTGTVTAVFALPVAIVPIVFSETIGIRHFVYHVCLGITIAIAGFTLLVRGESSDMPSIVNAYAMTAFLTTGLFAGLVYWLAAGRWAHRPRMRRTSELERRPVPPAPSPPVPTASPVGVPAVMRPNDTASAHSARVQPSQFSGTFPPRPSMQKEPRQPDDAPSSPSQPSSPFQPFEKVRLPSVMSRHDKQKPVTREQNVTSAENTPAEIDRLQPKGKQND